MNHRERAFTDREGWLTWQALTMTEGEVAFIDLYERFYRPVYAYCRRRTTGDVVDDVVAETFLIAWRKIDQVPRSSELPWLYGVAYRVVGHQWRATSRRASLDEKLKILGREPQQIPEELLVARHESRQVLEALSRLKAIDQEILILSAWEELPQADIAVALSISIGAVRQRLHEAKKNLAKQYERLDRKASGAKALPTGGTW